MILLFLIGVVGTVVVFTIISLIVSYFEYKHWNDGVCPVCGHRRYQMVQFDTDSQGGEGWTCKHCGYTTWVSYHKLVYDFWSNHFHRKHTTKV